MTRVYEDASLSSYWTKHQTNNRTTCAIDIYITMKFASVCYYSLALVACMAAAEGRLFHVPLTTQQDYHRGGRSLANADPEDVDLDNLYQARGIQYAALKVGT